MKKKFYFLLGVAGIFILGSFFISCSPHKRGEKKEVKLLDTDKVLQEAFLKEKEKDLLSARELYKKAFANLSDPKKIEEVKKKIEDLNLRIIFSRTLDKDSFLYEVSPGDTLAKIARRFNTTVELIKQSNGLKSDLIKVGEKLKVIKARFSLVIDKSQNLLFLKKDGQIIKTYVVSTGKDNSTPTGSFRIVVKLKNPVWYRKDIGAVVPPDSPDNILGSRWLGLDKKGYGIHGTTQPDNLGTQTTAGCIRMRNSDVEELFTLLPPGTEVTIID